MATKTRNFNINIGATGGSDKYALFKGMGTPDSDFDSVNKIYVDETVTAAVDSTPDSEWILRSTGKGNVDSDWVNSQLKVVKESVLELPFDTSFADRGWDSEGVSIKSASNLVIGPESSITLNFKTQTYAKQFTDALVSLAAGKEDSDELTIELVRVDGKITEKNYLLLEYRFLTTGLTITQNASTKLHDVTISSYDGKNTRGLIYYGKLNGPHKPIDNDIINIFKDASIIRVGKGPTGNEAWSYIEPLRLTGRSRVGDLPVVLKDNKIGFVNKDDIVAESSDKLVTEISNLNSGLANTQKYADTHIGGIPIDSNHITYFRQNIEKLTIIPHTSTNFDGKIMFKGVTRAIGQEIYVLFNNIFLIELPKVPVNSSNFVSFDLLSTIGTTPFRFQFNKNTTVTVDSDTTTINNVSTITHTGSTDNLRFGDAINISNGAGYTSSRVSTVNTIIKNNILKSGMVFAVNSENHIVLQNIDGVKNLSSSNIDSEWLYTRSEIAERLNSDSDKIVNVSKIAREALTTPSYDSDIKHLNLSLHQIDERYNDSLGAFKISDTHITTGKAHFSNITINNKSAVFTFYSAVQAKTVFDNFTASFTSLSVNDDDLLTFLFTTDSKNNDIIMSSVKKAGVTLASNVITITNDVSSTDPNVYLGTKVTSTPVILQNSILVSTRIISSHGSKNTYYNSSNLPLQTYNTTNISAPKKGDYLVFLNDSEVGLTQSTTSSIADDSYVTSLDESAAVGTRRTLTQEQLVPVKYYNPGDAQDGVVVTIDSSDYKDTPTLTWNNNKVLLNVYLTLQTYVASSPAGGQTDNVSYKGIDPYHNTNIKLQPGMIIEMNNKDRYTFTGYDTNVLTVANQVKPYAYLDGPGLNAGNLGKGFNVVRLPGYYVKTKSGWKKEDDIGNHKVFNVRSYVELPGLDDSDLNGATVHIMNDIAEPVVYNDSDNQQRGLKFAQISVASLIQGASGSVSISRLRQSAQFEFINPKTGASSSNTKNATKPEQIIGSKTKRTAYLNTNAGNKLPGVVDNNYTYLPRSLVEYCVNENGSTKRVVMTESASQIPGTNIDEYYVKYFIRSRYLGTGLNDAGTEVETKFVYDMLHDTNDENAHVWSIVALKGTYTIMNGVLHRVGYWPQDHVFNNLK